MVRVLLNGKVELIVFLGHDFEFLSLGPCDEDKSREATGEMVTGLTNSGIGG